MQIFFCNSKKKNICHPSPKSPKTRVPKTKSNLLQSPPIYTDSVASCNKSFHLFMYIQNIFKQLKDTTHPTSMSLLALTVSSPFLGWEFRPIASSRSALHTLTHSYRDTHTYIHKAQWIELWSNTSMNTPNCLVVSTVQKGKPVPFAGRHIYIQFPGGDGSLFMSSLSPPPPSSSSSLSVWSRTGLFHTVQL